jgi:hypothetical protein
MIILSIRPCGTSRVLFHAVKSYDMGPSRLTSHPRGRCAADFIALRNPSPWPGFELATFGSSGQHTNHYTSKATPPTPLPASNHRYKMSTGTSTVYKYVREHYPISNEHRGARGHQVENPCPRVRYVMYSEDLPHKRTRQN